MKLQALEIRSFRNISRVVLTDLGPVTVFVGPNGAGKTNVLEAIYGVRTGRPLRGASWRPGVRRGDSSFVIRSRENDLGASHTYGLGYDLVRGKVVTIDGLRTDLKTYLTGRPTLFFGPESSAKLVSSPSERRRLLDEMTFALWPSFYDVALQYSQILKRRQAVLKQRDESLLGALDPLFARRAAMVEDGRRRMVAGLVPHISSVWRVLRPQGGEVSISYSPMTEADLLERIARSRKTELRRGHSVVGPHRQDVSITVDGVDFRQALSRGETKVLMLAFVLAFVTLLMHQDREPILLVDDLASELDAESIDRAWRAILATGAQVFATALDDSLVRDGTVFHVRDGSVVTA